MDTCILPLRSYRNSFVLGILVLPQVIACLALCKNEALAESPRKSDVFLARQGGYFSYRIPCMAVTSRGTVLACCEGRKNDQWDYGEIDTVYRRSTDGGITWEPPKALVDRGKSTVNNNVFIVDRNDANLVHYLYCVDYQRCYYCRSIDDGLTFSEPVEITKIFEAFRPQFDWKLLATGPGHAIQLTGGRLLVPVWLSTSKDQYPSCVSVIYSDDQGATWLTGDIIAESSGTLTHPMEGVVVELNDGRVMINIRNEAEEHRRGVAISENGVNAWSKPKFDAALKEPICMASLFKISAPGYEKQLLLFANPDNVERTAEIGPNHYRDRKNLSLKLSRDDGASWPVSRVIEPGFSGYSDLAQLPDGTCLCLYERGGTDGSFYYDPQAISLARFNPEWVSEPKEQAID